MKKLKPDFFHRIAYLEWRKTKTVTAAAVMLIRINEFFDEMEER